MGVVYKITPEVASFIIAHKQNNPKASCQLLAQLANTQFNYPISKSSVHELLKRSQVITPKERKPKEKFQIPQEKKSQIRASLPVLAQDSPALVLNPSVYPKIEPPEPFTKPQPDASQPEVEKIDRSKAEIKPSQGEVFLKAALGDLSLKPVLGLQKFEDIQTLEHPRLKMEWQYLTCQAYSVKIETQEGRSFYVDCRYQGVWEDCPQQEALAAPIERAIQEAVDFIVTNIKPLQIKADSATCSNIIGYDISKVLENASGQAIIKVSLIGQGKQILAEFSPLLGFKRNAVFSQSPVICKLSPVAEDLNETITDQGQWLKNRLKERALMFFPQGVSLAALEEILSLQGFETKAKGRVHTHLLTGGNFPHQQVLEAAALQVCAMDVQNSQGEKIKVLIEKN